jgi:hypothetical protein
VSSADRIAGNGVVVYLGPSLAVHEAQGILPRASFRPPIALGDLISLVESESVPDLWAVGIVDGVFYQSPPVWHKEILHALNSGIAVFGASSMGALRAAECDVFGMIGVGAIYRSYAEGTLTDDDEVALVHGDASAGWSAQTLPLVNVRATFARAVEWGRIDDRTARVVVEAAKGLWFPERTDARILEAAGELDPGGADLFAAAELLAHEYVDLKRADAVGLLEAIAARATAFEAGAAEPPRPAFAVNQGMLTSLRERDRRLGRDGETLRAEEISRYVALCHPEFPSLRDRVLDRLAVEALAVLYEVEPTETERAEEMRRFRTRRRLDSDAAVADWCASNDLTLRDLHALVAEEARNRKIRNWVSMSRGRRKLVKPLLDTLRLSGEYESWATKARELHRSLPVEADSGSDTVGHERVRDLERDQMRAGGWRPDLPPVAWAEEAGFLNRADLVSELARHNEEREKRRRALATLALIFPDETSAAGGPVG